VYSGCILKISIVLLFSLGSVMKLLHISLIKDFG